MATLTQKQARILSFIDEYISENGYAPTLREIGEEFGVTRVTAHQHVGALEEKEFIEREPNQPRGLTIRNRPGHTGGKRADLDTSDPGNRDTTTPSYPLLGYIAAGQPIEAVESPETYSLNELVSDRDDCFLLEVKGRSMEGDHIREGDLVVVRKTSTASDGDMVVALTDEGDATLKRYYDESDRIRLQPSNPDHEPIYRDPEQVRVQGVVVGLIRDF